MQQTDETLWTSLQQPRPRARLLANSKLQYSSGRGGLPRAIGNGYSKLLVRGKGRAALRRTALRHRSTRKRRLTKWMCHFSGASTAAQAQQALSNVLPSIEQEKKLPPARPSRTATSALVRRVCFGRASRLMACFVPVPQEAVVSGGGGGRNHRPSPRALRRRPFSLFRNRSCRENGAGALLPFGRFALRDSLLAILIAGLPPAHRAVSPAPRLQKLYTYPNNKNAFKALIAAEINKVKIELPQFEFGVTNKTDKFVKLNPFAKVWGYFRPLVGPCRFRRPGLLSIGRLRREILQRQSPHCHCTLLYSLARFRFRPSRRRRVGSSRATPSLATSPALRTTACAAPPRLRRYVQ